jgi:hypothetical protein
MFVTIHENFKENFKDSLMLFGGHREWSNFYGSYCSYGSKVGLFFKLFL